MGVDGLAAGAEGFGYLGNSERIGTVRQGTLEEGEDFLEEVFAGSLFTI